MQVQETLRKTDETSRGGAAEGSTPNPPDRGGTDALVLDFGGAIGNGALVLSLPVLTAYFFFCWRFNGGALWPGGGADWYGWLYALVPTPEAAVFYAGWFLFQAALQQFLPGRQVEGTELPGGGRLSYRMNGLASFLVTAALAMGLHLSGIFDLRFLHDEFGALITVTTLWSFLFSAWPSRFGKAPDPRHLSGQPVQDFFMGTGHNPRLGGFDLKLFCEARPGLMLWMLINVGFASVQYDRYGFVSTSMALVLILQLSYVADYFFNEPAILTTMDIKHENFGFMLVFGDLVWVPLTYCLQAAYLVDHVHDLPWWAAVLIVALNFIGLAIFRTVNRQKDRFRRDPEGAKIWGKKAEYIETKQGSRLLLSGFWGWSRHFNYVGDLLMALSWSLPCGFGSLLPYFYPAYFAALLVHRERRDHIFCKRKYGADWDRYCDRVRWRILPFVY